MRCFEGWTTFLRNPFASCLSVDTTASLPTFVFEKPEKASCRCSPKGPISRPAAVGLYTLMTAYQLHTLSYTRAPTPTYGLQYAGVCGRAHVQTYRC